MRYSSIAAIVLMAALSCAAQNKAVPLSIQNVEIAQYEDGPLVPSGSFFVPGETVFLSFQVAGYRPTGEDEQSVKLSWQVEATDPAGVPIIAPESGKVETGISQEDKNWHPKIRQTIQVPVFAPSGTYRISMKVHDEIANADATKEASFLVHGREVESSPVLVIRNFSFYRGEQDEHPLEVAAYRPGDTVWIRFDITGYKFGEGNSYEVGYGITVLRPTGETTFWQPEAAVDRNQSFYARRYVPAALSLNLPKDLAPGEYTVIVTAEDKTGSQHADSKRTFTVER